MLQVNDFGKVMQIKMGHEVQGQVLYWTAAYLQQAQNAQSVQNTLAWPAETYDGEECVYSH